MATDIRTIVQAFVSDPDDPQAPPAWKVVLPDAQALSELGLSANDPDADLELPADPSVLWDARNYEVFGHLAGVRTYPDDGEPISSDRGLPRRVEAHTQAHAGAAFYAPDPNGPSYLLGSHDFGHATLMEILTYPWQAPLETIVNRQVSIILACARRVHATSRIRVDNVRLVFGFDS